MEFVPTVPQSTKTLRNCVAFWGKHQARARVRILPTFCTFQKGYLFIHHLLIYPPTHHPSICPSVCLSPTHPTFQHFCLFLSLLCGAQTGKVKKNKIKNNTPLNLETPQNKTENPLLSSRLFMAKCQTLVSFGPFPCFTEEFPEQLPALPTRSF